MTILAKFRCSNVSTPYPGAEQVDFHPVYADDGPNKKWSEATPSGSFTMTITNPSAHGAFTPGKEYKITLEEAPEGF